MKRQGNLWPSVVAFPNLLAAARRARRGKRHRPNVLRFDHDLEANLVRLQQELIAGTYRPGPYHTHTIYEPKQRLISAAPYRDRVVHHALCGVIEPVFERSFIYDTYASRAGKGTHAAVRRCQHFSRRFRYVLKMDIRKYFPSIDHDCLKTLIRRRIKDRDVLRLCDLIVDASNPQEPVTRWFPGDDLFTPSERRRGLPLGNQTSQLFANLYLDPLDHFLKDRLAIRGYVRYMDDFLVFGDDSRTLRAVLDRVERFLEAWRVEVHPDKRAISLTTTGVRFLGYRVFPTHRVLVKENVRRFRRRLRRLRSEYAEGRLAVADLRQRIRSWIAHAAQADTYYVRARVLSASPFTRAVAESPRPSRRFVQQ